MTSLAILVNVKKDFPEAIGYIMLNEGQHVEVYANQGRLIAELSIRFFMSRYGKDMENV